MAGGSSGTCAFVEWLSAGNLSLESEITWMIRSQLRDRTSNRAVEDGARRVGPEAEDVGHLVDLCSSSSLRMYAQRGLATRARRADRTWRRWPSGRVRSIGYEDRFALAQLPRLLGAGLAKVSTIARLGEAGRPPTAFGSERSG